MDTDSTPAATMAMFDDHTNSSGKLCFICGESVSEKEYDEHISEHMEGEDNSSPEVPVTVTDTDSEPQIIIELAENDSSGKLCLTCGMCVLEEKYDEHVARHADRIECLICGAKVEYEEYEDHLSDVHIDKTEVFRCTACHAYFKEGDYDGHVAAFHQVLCSLCGIFLKFNEYDEHMASCVHRQTDIGISRKPYETFHMCHCCPRLFEIKDSLIAHLADVHKDQIWYPCCQCHIGYRNREEYHNHLASAHKVNIPIVIECTDEDSHKEKEDNEISEEHMNTETIDKSLYTETINEPIKTETIDQSIDTQTIDKSIDTETIEELVKAESIETEMDESIEMESTDVPIKTESIETEMDESIETETIGVPIKIEVIDEPTETETSHEPIKTEFIGEHIDMETTGGPIMTESIDEPVDTEIIDMHTAENIVQIPEGKGRLNLVSEEAARMIDKKALEEGEEKFLCECGVQTGSRSYIDHRPTLRRAQRKVPLADNSTLIRVTDIQKTCETVHRLYGNVDVFDENLQMTRHKDHNYPTKLKQNKMMPSEKVVYCCCSCSKLYISQTVLMKHLKNHVSYACSFCRKLFCNQDVYEQHVGERHFPFNLGKKRKAVRFHTNLLGMMPMKQNLLRVRESKLWELYLIDSFIQLFAIQQTSISGSTVRLKMVPMPIQTAPVFACTTSQDQNMPGHENNDGLPEVYLHQDVDGQDMQDQETEIFLDESEMQYVYPNLYQDQEKLNKDLIGQQSQRDENSADVSQNAERNQDNDYKESEDEDDDDAVDEDMSKRKQGTNERELHDAKMQNQKDDSWFGCIHCPMAFRTLNDYYKHVRKHPTYNKKRDNLFWIKNRDQWKISTCTACGIHYPDKEGLETHRERKGCPISYEKDEEKLNKDLSGQQNQRDENSADVSRYQNAERNQDTDHKKSEEEGDDDSVDENMSKRKQVTCERELPDAKTQNLRDESWFGCIHCPMAFRTLNDCCKHVKKHPNYDQKRESLFWIKNQDQWNVSTCTACGIHYPDKEGLEAHWERKGCPTYKKAKSVHRIVTAKFYSRVPSLAVPSLAASSIDDAAAVTFENNCIRFVGKSVTVPIYLPVPLSSNEQDITTFSKPNSPTRSQDMIRNQNQLNNDKAHVAFNETSQDTLIKLRNKGKVAGETGFMNLKSICDFKIEQVIYKDTHCDVTDEVDNTNAKRSPENDARGSVSTGAGFVGSDETEWTMVTPMVTVKKEDKGWNQGIPCPEFHKDEVVKQDTYVDVKSAQLDTADADLDVKPLNVCLKKADSVPDMSTVNMVKLTTKSGDESEDKCVFEMKIKSEPVSDSDSETIIPDTYASTADRMEQGEKKYGRLASDASDRNPEEGNLVIDEGDGNITVKQEPISNEDWTIPEQAQTNMVYIHESSKKIFAESQTPDVTLKKTALCKCGICGQSFDTLLELRKHHRSHCEIAIHKSELSRNLVSDLNRPREHKDSHGPKDKEYACNVCKKVFYRSWHYKDHMKAHEMFPTSQGNKCQVCGIEFKEFSSLRRHFPSHYRDKARGSAGVFQDSLPDELLPSKKKYPCMQCDVVFNSRNKRACHVRYEHKGEINVCDVCDKTFASVSELKRHYRTHTGERPFACGECGKAFALSTTLKDHLMAHTGQRPFKCTVCGKTYSSSSILGRHKVTHLKVKKHKCPICGKSFAYSNSLTIHLRTHTNERPYTCEICKKTFTMSCHYRVHMRIHTGEKPYSCPYCDYKSGNYGSHYRHVRNHKEWYLESMFTKDAEQPESIEIQEVSDVESGEADDIEGKILPYMLSTALSAEFMLQLSSKNRNLSDESQKEATQVSKGSFGKGDNVDEDLKGGNDSSIGSSAAVSTGMRSKQNSTKIGMATVTSDTSVTDTHPVLAKHISYPMPLVVPTATGTRQTTNVISGEKIPLSCPETLPSTKSSTSFATASSTKALAPDDEKKRNSSKGDRKAADTKDVSVQSLSGLLSLTRNSLSVSAVVKAKLKRTLTRSKVTESGRGGKKRLMDTDQKTTDQEMKKNSDEEEDSPREFAEPGSKLILQMLKKDAST